MSIKDNWEGYEALTCAAASTPYVATKRAAACADPKSAADTKKKPKVGSKSSSGQKLENWFRPSNSSVGL